MRIALILACLTVLGCSTRGSYENLRQNHVNQCNAMPETAREECLQRTAPEYSEYQTEREQVLEADNQK